MAKRQRRSKQKTIRYFFLNDKIHKALNVSRSRDELIAWCYPDKKRVLYSYSQVKQNMKTAYSMSEVSSMLNKHKITIMDYILEGKVKKPSKIYPIGNPDANWSKYMFNDSDIYDIHEYILECGHASEMPSKNELRALLKHNIILYTKT